MTHPAYSSMTGRSVLKSLVFFGIITILCIAAYMILSSRPHEIIIDGKVIAEATSLGAARESVAQAKSAVAGKQLPEDIHLPQRIIFKLASNPDNILSVDAAAEIISKNISAEALLYTITADGKPVAALNDEYEAKAVLGKLQTFYDKLPGDLKGESSFKEKVKIKQQYAPLHIACASVDDAVEFLTTYTKQPQRHIVKPGERAVNIADKYGVPVSDIARLNPEIDITILEPNRSIIIRPGVKPITVLTKAFVTVATELKPPQDAYRYSRNITGKRTTKMVTVYENGAPVKSEIVSQVTTWKRPKHSEYRRRHRSSRIASKSSAISPATNTNPSSAAVEPKSP